MILIALGANLPSPTYGAPQQTLGAALARLADGDCKIIMCSSWYQTKPVPVSDQPDFIKAVASLETTLDPVALLAWLRHTEEEMGRVRSVPNAARIIDLDLLAYHNVVRTAYDAPPELPHPRMGERRFVLEPLCEIAPEWRHPVSGMTARDMLAALG